MLFLCSIFQFYTCTTWILPQSTCQKIPFYLYLSRCCPLLNNFQAEDLSLNSSWALFHALGGISNSSRTPLESRKFCVALEFGLDPWSQDFSKVNLVRENMWEHRKERKTRKEGGKGKKGRGREGWERIP